MSDDLHRCGPKPADYSADGAPCAACRKQFRAGDYTTLIFLGPGDDADAQERARQGRPYNAIAVEVHWACATGLAE